MNILVISINDLFSRWVTVSLATAGHRVSVMSPGGNRLARLSRHCHAHAACGPEALRHPDAALLDRIEAYCREHHVDWVVPADLPATLLLARRVRDLKETGLFPLARADLIEQFHDKWEFHRLLERLGLPTPRTRLIRAATDPALQELTFPLMIKPVRGEGGIGILRVDSPAPPASRLDAHGSAYGWPLLAQEFVPGRDIDLSVLADRGRPVAWTIQRRGGSPGALEFLHDPRVLEIGTALIRETGYHGVVHLDLRIDDRTGQPLVLEANPRFWGSLRHSLWSGVNFPALGIALARGEDVGRQFKPVEGPVADPGFSVRSVMHALLHGRLRPEHWSAATEAGWRCHLGDPMPELWDRLRRIGAGKRRVTNAAPL